MDLNVLKLTYFLILKRRALALFSFMERLLTWYCQLKFVSIFILRYLTLSVRYSLLPHNFSFKSSQILFCFNYHFNFFLLSDILFAFSTNNCMFGRMIWDKLPECIFEKFKSLKNHEGDSSPKFPKSNTWLLVNHTRPSNTLFWNWLLLTAGNYKQRAITH